MSRKMLCADDLALVSETSEGLKGRLEAWKKALEVNFYFPMFPFDPPENKNYFLMFQKGTLGSKVLKGLRVNVKMTKMMISREYGGKVTLEGKVPCALY